MNWTGKIAKYFIENSKVTGILLLGFFLWGSISFYLTPKKYNPTIIAPAFKITVDMPGASRDEIVEQVTKPLENVLTDISGVEDIYSVTSQGGRAEVFVNFYVGQNLDSAKIALNDRMQSDIRLAPLGIRSPVIESLDPEDVPVMTLALSSKELDLVSLRRKAFEIRDQLSRIEGTSRVFVVGGRKRELRIEIEPAKLQLYGLSLQQVSSALERNNIYLPAGTIKGDGEYLTLQTNAWVKNPLEVQEIVIVSNDTVSLKIRDVARVYETQEEIESFVTHFDLRLDERPNTVLLSLAKIRGTNISDVTDRVEDFVLNYKLPENVALSVLVNDGNTAREEISSLMMNLLTSIAIVVAVLFLFLSGKASILVAISIPLTLSSVFGLAYIAGQDINRITLFALILSLGLLVDNATVVIENIVRTIRSEKKINTDTFAHAVAEVGPGLFMATITTVLAFIPMNYISGMMGPYMGPIPFFVPAALFCALFISYSINPWMASLLITRHDQTKEDAEKLSRWKMLGMDFLLRYRQIIRHLMIKAKQGNLVLLSILLLIIISMSFPLLQFVKFRMLPKANVDQFYIYLDLPEGTPLPHTYLVTQEVENDLKQDRRLTMIQSYIGAPPILDFNGLFKSVSNRRMPHQATLRVGLLPDGQRDQSSEEIVIELRKKLEYLKREYKGLTFKLIEDPPGPPVFSTIQVRVQADNEKLLATEALALEPLLKEISQTVDHDLTLAGDTKDYYVEVDHLACSKAKVDPAQVVDTLNAFYSARIAGVYHGKNLHEQEYIMIRIRSDLRRDTKMLERLTVRIHYE